MTELDNLTIKRDATGDRKAFRQVYECYAPFVWRLAYRTANGDADAAAQIAQDTFVSVHRALPRFRFDSSFATWLYRIAFNEAQTFFGKRARQWARTVELDEESVAKPYVDGLEARDEVSAILGLLSPEERFLLVSAAVEGMTFEELSAATGRTAGALRVQVHRIRERIRKELSHGA